MAAQAPQKNQPFYPWMVNRQFDEAVSAADRGFNYGDGLFETVALVNSKVTLLDHHLNRLSAGLKALGFNDSATQLWSDLDYYLTKVELPAQALLKLIVTRGVSARGYRPALAPQLTIAIKANDWEIPVNADSQQGVHARLCDTHLGCNPALAGIKHLNRLEQVLARSEWQDENIFEGLMCDVNGYLVECTMSNLFFVIDDTVHTPILDRCGVAGVMRSEVLARVLPVLSLRQKQGRYAFSDLRRASEVFISNSLIGVVPLLSCEHFRWGHGPVTKRIQAELAKSVFCP